MFFLTGKGPARLAWDLCNISPSFRQYLINRAENNLGSSIIVEPCTVTVRVPWLLRLTAHGDQASIIEDIRITDEGSDWVNVPLLKVKVHRIVKKIKCRKECMRILRAT